MNIDPHLLQTPPVPVALFIDGDNFNALGIPEVFQRIQEWIPHAVLVTKKVYADFAEQSMLPWKDVCIDSNLQTIQCWRRNQKNSVDMKMACDIHDMIYQRPDIQTYILCTGDRDFIEVIQRIHFHGKRVIGISTNLKGTSKAFQKECDLFTYVRVDALEAPLPVPAPVLVPVPPPPKKVEVKAKAKASLLALVPTPSPKKKKGLSPLPVQEIKPLTPPAIRPHGVPGLTRSEKRQIRKLKKAKVLAKQESDADLFDGILAREAFQIDGSESDSDE